MDKKPSSNYPPPSPSPSPSPSPPPPSPPPPSPPPPSPPPTQDEIARLLLEILRNVSGQATTPRALSTAALTAIANYGAIAADLATRPFK
jgi:hypothetical protein